MRELLELIQRFKAEQKLEFNKAMINNDLNQEYFLGKIQAYDNIERIIISKLKEIENGFES